MLKNIVLFYMKICFTFTKGVDLDEMQHSAAFHLGIHCLQMYSLISLIHRVKPVKLDCLVHAYIFKKK